jgi:hypothetical protein
MGDENTQNVEFYLHLIGVRIYEWQDQWYNYTTLVDQRGLEVNY